ncbi:MAG: DUF222 domain-containing protein [Rhodoglobus sp.]
MTPTDTLTAAFMAAVDVLTRVSKDAADYRALDDSVLLELNRLASIQRQLVDAHAVVLAGEIAHRSAPSLGHGGLAQRSGYRTPEELIRVSTRSTAREASTAVRVGRMVREATDSAAPIEPWLLPLSEAIPAGLLPVASADAIRTGLGAPSGTVTSSLLADAATRLCVEAATLDPDRLFRRARELRDELDEQGIADREAERRARRSLKVRTHADGSGELVWRFDPETAAVVTDLYDRATSPRRGGPRFVDAQQAQSIADDDRTTEQLASDVFLQLLRQGADADDSQLLGSGAPSIRVLVHSDATHGFIEGQADPISIESVVRLACAGTTLTIRVDSSGQPLDLGRKQRLHSPAQRVALAARDGGCRFPGCDRPPSWTEAHHIQHWDRDHGSTSVKDGMLLCRHHHLLVHNNGWEIERTGGEYWLLPPASAGDARERIPMPTKSRAMRELVVRGPRRA